MVFEARIKSEIWVMAHIRRVFAHGATACVARRGDADAGAIFVRVNRLDGTAQLFAPSWATDEGARRWSQRNAGTPMSEAEVEAITEQAAKFDPDIWVIEIDDRQGCAHLDEYLTSE
ncbi:MAG: DUF1491 family protein [Alphaproteobacteria bacterium]